MEAFMGSSFLSPAPRHRTPPALQQLPLAGDRVRAMWGWRWRLTRSHGQPGAARTVRELHFVRRVRRVPIQERNDRASPLRLATDRAGDGELRSGNVR